jgi:hypothetical protein
MTAAAVLDPVRATALQHARSYGAQLGEAAVAGVADDMLREYAARFFQITGEAAVRTLPIVDVVELLERCGAILDDEVQRAVLAAAAPAGRA